MAGSRAIKFAKNLKELRFHMCQSSRSSAGARGFVEEIYPELKKEYPKFPFLVRECSNVQPKIYARYAKGKETSITVADLDTNQVFKAVKTLAE